ncbi:MAG: hypothetical protein FJ313_05305, partial [Gemmatimonadetes bacterium]|nr:hypothetical protein [Gemmatimonadota bacterium]
LAATAWDGWWVAAALMKGEARREGLRGRRRRSGRGPLLILGALGLLALGALVRTGDAVSYSLLAVVATAGWLMWRRGLSRAPVDYRPPQEPEEPTEE